MKTPNQIIAWNAEMLTGIAQIDEQHHMLVNMFNEAIQRLSDAPPPDVQYPPDRLAELIHNLMSYALYHFETEEILMQENHYDPRQQAMHIQEHRTFSAKVADFHKALSQGESESPEAVLSFLSDWLRDHILNTDKKLGEFLSTTYRPTS